MHANTSKQICACCTVYKKLSQKANKDVLHAGDDHSSTPLHAHHRLGAHKSVVFGALHSIGGTQHIERFNAMLRVRLAHLVRCTLSFSRKQANLEMLIWLFIHRYNTSLR